MASKFSLHRYQIYLMVIQSFCISSKYSLNRFQICLLVIPSTPHGFTALTSMPHGAYKQASCRLWACLTKLMSMPHGPSEYASRNIVTTNLCPNPAIATVYNSWSTFTSDQYEYWVSKMIASIRSIIQDTYPQYTFKYTLPSKLIKQQAAQIMYPHHLTK